MLLSADNIPIWYAKQDCSKDKSTSLTTASKRKYGSASHSIRLRWHHPRSSGRRKSLPRQFTFLLTIVSFPASSEHAEAAKKVCLRGSRLLRFFWVQGQAFICTANSLSCAAFCLYAWPNALWRNRWQHALKFSTRGRCSLHISGLVSQCLTLKDTRCGWNNFEERLQLKLGQTKATGSRKLLAFATALCLNDFIL
jgi:hypothetical protein